MEKRLRKMEQEEEDQLDNNKTRFNDEKHAKTIFTVSAKLNDHWPILKYSSSTLPRQPSLIDHKINYRTCLLKVKTMFFFSKWKRPKIET